MLKSETNFHGVSNLNKLSKRWLKHSVFFPAKLFETRCVPVPMLQVLQEFSAHDAAAFCWDVPVSFTRCDSTAAFVAIQTQTLLSM